MTQTSPAPSVTDGREIQGAQPKIPAATEHDLRTALAALRSSAEILRDHPDISHGARDQFVNIVLAEQARLETVLRPFFAQSRVAG